MEVFLAGMLIGLAGSLHCVGMCGPLVMLLPKSSKAALTSVVYHLGRVTVYVLLGLFFGSIIQWLDLRKFEQGFSLVLGGLFIVLWLKSLFSKNAGGGFISDFVNRYFGKVIKGDLLGGWFLAGMLNGLLPCGLVYGALLASLGSGNAIGAVYFMLGFGLATVPAMVLVYLTKNIISNKIRFSLNKILPYWLLIMGVVFLLRGANLGIPYLSPKFEKNLHKSGDCCKPK